MTTPIVDPVALGRLARLDFSATEVKHFHDQLPQIIDYVGQLQQVPVSDHMIEVPKVIALRPDEARPSKVIEKILAEAPERQDRYWKVASVF